MQAGRRAVLNPDCQSLTHPMPAAIGSGVPQSTSFICWRKNTSQSAVVKVHGKLMGGEAQLGRGRQTWQAAGAGYCAS